MKKYREHKRFKREYIPVIITFIILVVLVTGLVFVLKDNKKDFDIDIDKDISNTEEISVDTKNTKCNNEDANKFKDVAKKVNISYQVKEIVAGEGIDIDEPGAPAVELHDLGFEISIKNITEDIYVVVKNDYSNDTFTYHYKDTENGTKTFQSLANDENVTFTFEIKSENSNCINETFRKVSLTTPIYNSFSEKQYCVDNPKLDICQKFVGEKYTSEDFDKEVSKNNKDNKTDNSNENKNNFIKDNKYLFIIGGSVIVIIGVATALVQVKKRRSRQI